MIFKPYYYFETGCAAYLFGCGGLGRCAVVDAHEGSGGPALAKQAGAAYCLHVSADVALPFEPLHDGQEIELGNARVKVLHTPGHTPACGAGMSDNPSSTLAFEKRNSPLLSKSRDEFIDALSNVPPKPAAMHQILRVNQGREAARR